MSLPSRCEVRLLPPGESVPCPSVLLARPSQAYCGLLLEPTCFSSSGLTSIFSHPTLLALLVLQVSNACGSQLSLPFPHWHVHPSLGFGGHCILQEGLCLCASPLVFHWLLFPSQDGQYLLDVESTFLIASCANVVYCIGWFSPRHQTGKEDKTQSLLVSLSMLPVLEVDCEAPALGCFFPLLPPLFPKSLSFLLFLLEMPPSHVLPLLYLVDALASRRTFSFLAQNTKL